SSGFSARSSVGAIEPDAQTIASETFDFPDPFGPTTTATPGSRRTSTGSGNDLKPRRQIELRCTRKEASFPRGCRVEPPVLGLARHSQDLVSRHRSDHVGVLVLDVRLDVRDELVVGVAADGLSARTVDLLRHGFSSQVARGSYAPPSSIPNATSACFAASCSADFFDSPLPTPTWSPSMTAEQVNRRSWGGPSTSSTV